MDSKILKENIKKILDDKKAIDIEEVCVKDKTTITDYFIIASGAGLTQVKSLSERVEYELSQMGFKPKRIEGDKNSGWILMDYGDVIIHIFLPEVREKYSLSDLWKAR